MRRLALLLGMVVPLLLAGCASFRTAASSHPSDQSVTQTIGAKGGRVVFSSGAIDVPPNAFATNTAVRVTLVGESQVKDTLGPGWHPIGPGIRVDLSQQPSSPLTLTVGAGLPVGVDANATFLAAHLSEEAASAALRAPSTDGTGASARSSGPSGTTLPSPSQVVMLPLAAAAGALSASLPGAGWFGAGWLDAQATVERLLPQVRQGFLEFSKLRTPRPADCPATVDTPSGVVSFDSAPWRGDPDPDIWVCLGAVPGDAGKVAVTLTDNRPLLWQGSLPPGSVVTQRNLLTDLFRGNGYALLVQGLNDLTASAGGRSAGPELGPAAAISVDVPISALDDELTLVPDRYGILMGAFDFGFQLLMSVELGAAKVIQPIAEDVGCLLEASTAFADRLDTIIASGTMTLENFVFLADVLKGCWQQYLNSPSEILKGVAEFGLLLLTSGLPAMYDAVDPVVRMLSGATSVVVPLHLEPGDTAPGGGAGDGTNGGGNGSDNEADGGGPGTPGTPGGGADGGGPGTPGTPGGGADGGGPGTPGTPGGGADGGGPGTPGGGVPPDGAGAPDQSVLPDLVPINYRATTDCGQQWLEAEIANQGQADAGPFTSQWLLDGTPVASYPLPGLVAGGKRVFDFPISAMTPGQHTAVLEVNVGGQVLESNTGNDRIGQQDTWPTCASVQPVTPTTTEPPHDYTGGYRLPCVLPDGSQGEIERWTGNCGPVQ